ncbi:unnamed protein product [Rhizophagus irregularis]|nr:unnamed protein product [Rhizophagus irregularis]
MLDIYNNFYRMKNKGNEINNDKLLNSISILMHVLKNVRYTMNRETYVSKKRYESKKKRRCNPSISTKNIYTRR